jgi:hypothetical protein
LLAAGGKKRRERWGGGLDVRGGKGQQCGRKAIEN